VARRLEVQIVGDASSLERAFDRANRSAQKFNRDMSKAGRGGLAASGLFKGLGRDMAFASTSFLSGAGLVAGLKAATEAASNLNEMVGQSQVVFGDAAAGVQAWSKTTTSAFGLSQRQALATADAFGALFAPIGIVGQQAAKQSERLTQLGADLASFYDTDVQSALDAIRSGIVGESEPLRRYGVQLSEARVQQEALAETGKRHASQLTLQEKALARINIILRDTVKAQGDAARSSGRFAEKLKVAQANVDNLSAALGEGLIPQLTSALGLFNASAGPLAGLINKTRQATEGQSAFSKALGVGKDLMLAWGPSFAAYAIYRRFTKPTREATASLDAFNASLHATQTLIQGIKPGNIMPGTEFQPGAAHPVNITAEQRNQFRDRRLQRMLDRVQDIKTLQGQIGRLKEIAATIKKWQAAADDVTRQQTLQDQWLQVQRQIADDQAQLAQNASDAADRAAEKRKKLLEKQRERETAREFGILGLGPTGDDPIPGMKALRRQLQRVAARLKGTELDTRGNRSLLARIRKALDFKSLEPEVRQKIRDLLDGIQDEFQKGADRLEVTRFRGVNAHQFMRSLGIDLSPAEQRRLFAQISGLSAGKGGPTVTGGAGAFALAGGTVINGPVTINGVQDAKGMEQAFAKRGKARPHQRRGAR